MSEPWMANIFRPKKYIIFKVVKYQIFQTQQKSFSADFCSFKKAANVIKNRKIRYFLSNLKGNS